MNDQILERQRQFYARRHAGCLFAAMAARDPEKYGWRRVLVPELSADAIDRVTSEAINAPDTSTLSLLFPRVTTARDLLALVELLKTCTTISLAMVEEFGESTCLGFRALVGDKKSFVTGFGDFDFLPRTRRAPCVELVTRVKPRPAYDFVFKEAPSDTLHLADLDMKGMDFEVMKQLWDNSFVQTEGILGAKPDLRSAARTTFSLPTSLLSP